jgi:AcrR family transcriptional regulator
MTTSNARTRRTGPRRGPARDTRADLFRAAADLLSARGFDGVGVDDIAHAAQLNKAMIYYHFDDKLALYREIVRDMLRTLGTVVAGVADRSAPADIRLTDFVAAFVDMAEKRPWCPTLMLREIAEGAPRLDPETLTLMKTVFMAFSRILADGQRDGLFRPINSVLAYMSTLGPILLNAARQRVAAQPGRIDLPMFAQVPPHDVLSHMQQSALRLLLLEPRP